MGIGYGSSKEPARKTSPNPRGRKTSRRAENYPSKPTPRRIANRNSRFRESNSAINLGQRLIDAIPECARSTNRVRGNYQHDADSIQKPGLIAELDRLHLTAPARRSRRCRAACG